MRAVATYDLNRARKVSEKYKENVVFDSLIDMSWYDVWLSQQLENLPYCLRELRIQGESLLAGLCLDKLFDAIRDFTQINEGVSIDEIVRHLQNIDILDNASDLLGPQRLLIFAVLGWRSMLYQAGFNVCSIQELAVHQDSSQPQSGFVFDTYKVPAELSDRPLSVLLKAFGNILPARSSTVPQVASETSKLASSWLPLYPVETNAYMLHTLLRVHIRWVDALALHLDYDKSNPRADKEDISQLLREVLLSYRLLFGQSAKSRRLFRQIFKPSEKHGSLFDSLLPLTDPSISQLVTFLYCMKE
ncbi:hypothetical protein EYZ11_010602 [Aspergillus tanneri]|uniref:Uncharacterized protein n=1 Tax=Aspergillus tanneri TaxID=1220188 RepID=A0A4S3J731_9EURO|nr:hypothetical protein EYZ11_010602 [Aspergillus tanneri]